MSIVVVTGCRNWKDRDAVFLAIAKADDRDGGARTVEVVHGGATGADACARWAASKLELDQHEFAARWGSRGRAAGPERNQRMIDFVTRRVKDGDEAIVFAFHDDLAKSKGTGDMVRRALSAGIETWLWDGKGGHGEPSIRAMLHLPKLAPVTVEEP